MWKLLSKKLIFFKVWGAASIGDAATIRNFTVHINVSGKDGAGHKNFKQIFLIFFLNHASMK